MLDYIEGSDVQTKLGRRLFSAVEAVGIMTAVAEGIAHAHAHGVVHGDLKPGNVLLDLAGRPIVTDFGLAHLMHPGSDASTRQRSIGGTAGFIAPEVLRGSGPPTVASDIYSLGAMAWVLVTGSVPLGAADVCATDVGESYAALCRRCLSENPANRYASAPEFAQALASLKPN